LSGEPLRAPIVVCELGKLYNRTSVIEFLLGEGVFTQNREELKKNGFGHITSIKNVFEVKMTKNDVLESKKATTNLDTTTHDPGLFVCPVTQLETNGMHQFCALKTCGHVFSEKALNLFQELSACWTCNVPYTKDDILPIYGNEKALVELEEKLKQRQERDKEERKEKKDKKDKKRKRKEEKEKGKEKKLAIEGPTPSSSSSSSSTTTTTTTTSTSSSAMPPPPDRKKVKA